MLLFFFSSYGYPRDLHSFPTRRSSDLSEVGEATVPRRLRQHPVLERTRNCCRPNRDPDRVARRRPCSPARTSRRRDRKSTRLNSSHTVISYAVFCLKKKKKTKK